MQWGRQIQAECGMTGRTTHRELVIPILRLVTDARKAERDYAREVGEEGRKGIQLVVLGAYTRHCAWVHNIQAPDAIQDQVHDGSQPGS